MLDKQTISIIKSTVPILEEQGETITTRFYEKMFTNHPELLNIFNHANQKQGRQQKALANAVYAAAKHIDQLESILPVVQQIGHKHRSLGIKPEHYPIVGKHLLLAIKDVLGEAATDEIMNAWKKAYEVIANVFIQVEEGLYKKAEEDSGGWKDFKSFIVDHIVKESDCITSFYLKPADGGAISPFIPGQYISIRVKVPGSNYFHIRQYSLSDAPNKSYYRISVKKEHGVSNKPAGIVSNYLHDSIQVGDELEISPPAGDFILQDTDEPIIFLSGGVGITPLISMMNELLEQKKQQPITIIHAAINGNQQAFRKHLLDAAGKQLNINYFSCLERPTDDDLLENTFDKEGYITKDWLSEIITNHSCKVYMCGPISFMQAMFQQLQEIGINSNSIRYEFFGPAAVIKETQTV
ncbi:NO-inducible flavohemoprotein [Cytobacillus spongiae]|uniref:NO-inducible flavohemoprotein n=1 Tax=Cytobacillus spongiae TaxID=2901381 RepID=UPI001F480F32|nr:NO-inducible flavohemoprotein [Cytobacillus spongiae]UII57328.1 NO-inducible flavohemoprotein [Cytobacillus spongiae]